MMRLESGNGRPISFGQGSTSPTNGSGFRPRPLPFEIQQEPSRISPDLPLPLSLRPDPPVDTSGDTSDSSRNFRGMIGIGVALLIIFLLRG